MMKYFDHDTSAGNDPKVMALRIRCNRNADAMLTQCGCSADALRGQCQRNAVDAYYVILEHMYCDERPFCDAIDGAQMAPVSHELCMDVEDLAAIIKVCIDLGLFYRDEDGNVCSERAKHNIQAYEDKAQKSRKAAASRWSQCGRNADAMRTHSGRNAKEKEKGKEKNKEKTIQKRNFVPPTPDEVDAYCTANNYPLSAEQFCDFYASKGWKVGSAVMKDWKAAARNWSRRDKTKGGTDDGYGFIIPDAAV